MDVKSDNVRYWTQRAAGYAEINRSQLSGAHANAWAEAVCGPIFKAWNGREPHSLRILDIGCGPGIFSIILAQRGFDVTAVDYTPEMLDQARMSAEKRGLSVETVCADAEDLPFADGAFHAVVSRNLTWNLPHPAQAYRQWARVLAPGGIIVNFDANWYLHLADPIAQRAYEHDRELTARSGVAEACEIKGYEAMEEIARHVPLTSIPRPAWDEHVLGDLGLQVDVDAGIWESVWDQAERVNFASTPLFRIVATKMRQAG